MLTWDDDATPATLQPRLQPATALPTSAIAEVAMAKPATTSVAKPASTPTDASQRRVNAADKRIINGQTDVNQLVPFKY